MRSRTQVGRVSRNLVVWESVVPELGVELHSACSGMRGGDARVEHLALSPACVDIDVEPPEAGWSVISSDRKRGMYVHLLRLQELLERSGYSAHIISQPGRLERLRAGWLR
ncbi:MAG: hypothetical protein M3018_03045 [Actinomycetota bacterium]|nr:hypothetical protein [Actinomycetota bacterium]